MKFRALKDGDITALKYYRGSADANDTDTRTLHLWNSSGKELAEVTVTSASGATGWQTAALSTPVHLTANSQYVVSYGTTQNYADSVNYFSGAQTNADGTLSVSGAAGVFSAQGRLRQRPGFLPDADLECLQLLGGRGLQGLGVGFKLLQRRRGCP